MALADATGARQTTAIDKALILRHVLGQGRAWIGTGGREQVLH